jgi:expansin
VRTLALTILLTACGGGGGGGGGGGNELVTYGDAHTGGQFHLGPVDWDESQWHNACAPGTRYAAKVRAAEGELLAGLWNGIPDVARYCDACIHVETARGKSAVLRVVTYGDTSPNSIDVSPSAFALLDSGEFPRTMTWKFARCPDTGPVLYEFQTGSSEWWTSLWVRNARVPLNKVEARTKNRGSYQELTRGGDGTLTDAGGFGVGPFSFRLTGVDGQTLVEDLSWPSGGIAGQLITGTSNLR